MAATFRNKVQIERDRQRIVELYCQGVPQFKIAADVHLSSAMVSYDLRVIQKRWSQATSINLDEAKGRELTKIDNLERTYLDAWQRSLQGKESQESGKVELPRGIMTHARLRKENTFGEGAFLNGVQWCIEMRCKILQLVKSGGWDNAPFGGEVPGGMEIKTWTIVRPLPPGEDGHHQGELIEGTYCVAEDK